MQSGASRVSREIRSVLICGYGVMGQAVATTFAQRGTHAVPTDLPPPPSAWERPFTALAAECGIVHTLTSAYESVAAYWRSLTERSEAPTIADTKSGLIFRDC